MAKEAAKKKAEADKEQKAKDDFENEVKASALERKNAAIAKQEVGEDQPTADEAEAAAKAATAKKTFPKQKLTDKEVKLSEEYDHMQADYKEKVKLDDADAKATLAVKVGE